jgi:hypothetical protein
MRVRRKGARVLRKDEHVYWASKFDVSEAALRDAIEAVGPNLPDVERHIEALKNSAADAGSDQQAEEAAR